MKARAWMIVGALVGVGISAGRVPYLAGAARSLANTAMRVVGSAGTHLIDAAANHGAGLRTVLGITAVVALLLPGVTALLLVVAARATARIRSLIALALAALGAAAFFYQPKGTAAGALVLALAVGGLAVALSGPFLVAPLAGLAGLIGGEYLPRLFTNHPSVPAGVVSDLHRALLSSPGTPGWTQVLALIVALLPFAAALRLILRR